MASTTVIQTRIAPELARLLDQRASESGIPRAELLRMMIEGALGVPQPNSLKAPGPLLSEIVEELGLQSWSQ